jgi:hypothetical protein
MQRPRRRLAVLRYLQLRNSDNPSTEQVMKTGRLQSTLCTNEIDMWTFSEQKGVQIECNVMK